MSKVKCQECGQMLEKTEAVMDEKKYYHSKCVQDKHDRKELYAVICDIFHFKAPGPRIYAQIKKYVSEGMTYKGISYSLEYFFRVKNNSLEKANNGIGIVPFIYEEANTYFNRINYKKEKIAESAKNIESEKRVVVIKQHPTKQKKEIFDMNDF